MAPLNILLADWKFLHAPNVTAGAHKFITERNPIWDYVSSHANDLVSWLSQPLTLVLCLGFGPSGIAAGSLAAAYQAWAYGAFTPAGGIFATLTSLGMIGVLAPAVAAPTSVIVIPDGTRSVFQSLLDTVKTLSADKAFGSVLDGMDMVPAMQDKLRGLREKERFNVLSRKQLLNDFNRDRDDLLAGSQEWQKEKQVLQQEVLCKADSAKEQEVKQQKGKLEQNLKQIQGLNKAIEAEKQKNRSLQTSLEEERGRLTNIELEFQQLHKAHSNLQKRADWDAKKLQDTAELSISFIDEPPNLQPFDVLWSKMVSTISSTFSKDITIVDCKIETFRSGLDRLGRWNKDLPLPESNSQAAKEMRSVAVLASVTRIIVRQLFRPTYLLAANSGLEDVLIRQVKDHSAKESNLKAAFLTLLPQEQEATIFKR
ncbi:hypothetical protein Q7P37_003029 [Cladosporium fusiforme]